MVNKSKSLASLAQPNITSPLPIVLSIHFCNQGMVSTTKSPLASQPPKNNPNKDHYLQHIYMNTTKVNLQTCNWQYETPIDIAPIESNEHPLTNSCCLLITQPNVDPPSKVPKDPLQHIAHNPHAMVTNHYSIVDDVIFRSYIGFPYSM